MQLVVETCTLDTLVRRVSPTREVHMLSVVSFGGGEAERAFGGGEAEIGAA
jgi:hypothetical protein